MTKIKFKKFLETAKQPTKAHAQDSCFDLYVAEVKGFRNGYYEVDFGVGLEMPPNFEAVVRPRSSISKSGLVLANSLGTIDVDFRGSITARFYAPNGVYKAFKVGDRAAQITFAEVPEIEFEEVSELGVTERGAGGYGSSGS